MNRSTASLVAMVAGGWVFPTQAAGTSKTRHVDDAWPAVGSRLNHSFEVWPALINDTAPVGSTADHTHQHATNLACREP